MASSYVLTFWTLGRLGPSYPDLGFIATKNTFDAMTTAGYIPFSEISNVSGPDNGDVVVLCSSTDKGLFWASLVINYQTKTLTLVPFINPGSVRLPVVSGDLAKFLGTSGEIEDANIVASDTQLIDGIVAARSANIGGAGAGPIDISITGVTTSSIALASIVSSSNPVGILKVLPGAGKISVTFTGNPGASAIINYIVYVSSQ